MVIVTIKTGHVMPEKLQDATTRAQLAILMDMETRMLLRAQTVRTVPVKFKMEMRTPVGTGLRGHSCYVPERKGWLHNFHAP